MRLTVTLAALLVCGAESAMAQPDPLLAHRWQHRVLLVFTPSMASPSSHAISAAISDAWHEFQDRDLIVGRSTADGYRLAGEAVAEDVVSEWRASLGLGPEQVNVVLIGKDGGVKATYGSIPDLAQVFALIDGMPMRRAEMRARSTPDQREFGDAFAVDCLHRHVTTPPYPTFP